MRTAMRWRRRLIWTSLWTITRGECQLCMLLFLVSTMPITAATNLTYIDLGAGGAACCLLPDGLGNVYVVAKAAGESGANVSITRLDAANRVVANFRLGGLSDEPHAAALDPQGNLVIGGETRSSDFPLIRPVIPQTELEAPAG